MKINRTFQIVLLSAMITGMAGCKDNKKDTPNQRENQENSEMPAKNTEMEMENDGERQAMPEDAAGVGAAAQTGGSTGASNTLKMGTDKSETPTAVNLDAMYSELDMRDEQIQKFKTAMGNEQLNTLQNASGELPGNLYDSMQSELESILDESQLKKYREWKKGQ